MAEKVGKTRLRNYFPLIIITTLKSIVYIVDTLTDRCCFSFSHWIYQNKFYHSLPAGVNIHIRHGTKFWKILKSQNFGHIDIDFDIENCSFKILILILISENAFPKYWFWYWFWKFWEFWYWYWYWYWRKWGKYWKVEWWKVG